jgi:hypothetical protein
LALLDLVSPTTEGTNRTLDDLKAGIEKLPASLQVTFRVLLDEAGHDIERFKTQLEIWFNNTMDRASGWYKRKTQAIQLVLALAIVVIANVDSIRSTEVFLELILLSAIQLRTQRIRLSKQAYRRDLQGFS